MGILPSQGVVPSYQWQPTEPQPSSRDALVPKYENKETGLPPPLSTPISSTHPGKDEESARVTQWIR